MMKHTDNKGGMSRAAKKRAKKKQKRPHKASEEEEDGGDARKPSISTNKKSKRDAHESDPVLATKPEEEDPPLLDEVHSSSEDDEEVEMKGAASESLPTELAALPRECQSLREILLLDDDHDNDNDDDGSASAFRRMTSRQRAHCALQFLLQPADISVAHFYDVYWEKQPLLVSAATGSSATAAAAAGRQRLDGFLSLQSIRALLTATNERTVYYGKDLNLTRYQPDSHGVQRRVTLDKLKQQSSSSAAKNDQNSADAADAFVAVNAKELWQHWDSGCTIRLLCPHQHSQPLHSLLSLLELEWGCMVGANAYLTPPAHSQGFAPHYDDIEAFCLQLEGRKRWRVYKPLEGQTLPRVSSEDFTEADLKGHEPVMDVILEPGDLLYMPRGWIHQACTLQDSQEHSLHVTVSCQQQWAWADLMEILLPEALEASVASSSSSSSLLRQGLPPRFLDYMGAMHDNRQVPDVLKSKAGTDDDIAKAGDDDDDDDDKNIRKLQDEFRAEAKKRIMRVAKNAVDMLDAACDQMGKRFLSDRLPPALTASEQSATSQATSQQIRLLPNHLVRLARPGIARLVLENDMAVLYHCADNSLVFHEHPVSPMEFELDDAPAIEQLLTCHEPHWIVVNDLIHDSIEDKLGVAQALYDEGILALRSMET